MKEGKRYVEFFYRTSGRNFIALLVIFAHEQDISKGVFISRIGRNEGKSPSSVRGNDRTGRRKRQDGRQGFLLADVNAMFRPKYFAADITGIFRDRIISLPEFIRRRAAVFCKGRKDRRPRRVKDIFVYYGISET